MFKSEISQEAAERFYQENVPGRHAAVSAITFPAVTASVKGPSAPAPTR